MTDVLLYDTPDGGEINVAEGRVELTDDLRTMAYLCLFGGNERDSAGDETQHLQWWGNLLEQDASRHLRSSFQHKLATVPLTPGNLPRFEAAAARDLEVIVNTGVATTALVVARITAPKTLALDVSIEVNGQQYPFSFLGSGTAQ